jgi:DNA topoisomerase-1
MPARASGDEVGAAEAAGLVHVTDARPGIRRRRAGRGFAYVAPDGRPVRDPAVLRRIRALAIPPAWAGVWICPSPRGHLQATGRDARGRKQYRYHARWRAVRDASKYDRMVAFAGVLPRIRAATARDLARPDLPREKVLAAVVRLLEGTLVRVGNAEYARANGSFGLTTLRSRHADVSGSTVRLQFRGKGGKLHAVSLTDRRLARIVRRCQELPGQELFQYVEPDGTVQTVDSADVNAYLRQVAGEDFTAKDFRTWTGTVLAAVGLGARPRFDSRVHARRNVGHAIEAVALRLGNTPAICRKSYVHPLVLDAYLDGTLASAFRRRAARAPDGAAGGLQRDEAAVLALLRRRLARDGTAAAA